MNNQPPNTSPNDNNQPISETEKNLSAPTPHTYKLIIAILLLLLLATTALAAYFYLNPRDIPEETPAPTPQTQTQKNQVPTGNPTANWETYTNQEYGFSFKYPPHLELSEKNSQVNLTYGDPTGPEAKSAFAMNVRVIPESLQAIIKDSPCETPESEDEWPQKLYQSCLNTFNQYLQPYTQGEINGYQSLHNPYEHASVVTFFEHNNQTFMVTSSGADGLMVPNKNDSAHNTLNQLLSTFKFTSNQTETNQKVQIRAAVTEHLSNPQVNINSISLLGNHTDVYVVGINEKDNPGAGTILVGQQNNKWTIPKGNSELYCSWIETAGVDQADMAFLGPSCDFSQ